MKKLVMLIVGILFGMVLTSFSAYADGVGCPLDAISYDAPAFIKKYYYSSECMLVKDRISGQQWWLLRVGREFIVLDIRED